MISAENLPDDYDTLLVMTGYAPISGIALKCGHIFRAGHSCRARRFRGGDRCGRHLPRAEFELRTALCEAIAEKLKRIEDDEGRGPACWAWPVLPEHRAASVAAIQARWAGMTVVVDILDTWQDGRCAICGSVRPGLLTDHDHVTGLVRGLLCPHCNTQEPGSISPRFVGYRRRPPTAMLNVSALYDHPIFGTVGPEVVVPLDRDPAYRVAAATLVSPSRPGRRQS